MQRIIVSTPGLQLILNFINLSCSYLKLSPMRAVFTQRVEVMLFVFTSVMLIHLGRQSQCLPLRSLGSLLGPVIDTATKCPLKTGEDVA